MQLDRRPEAEIRAALGTDFPKAPFHAIACIGALVASFRDGAYNVDALGAPHTGERSEAELIEAFLGPDRGTQTEPRHVQRP